MLAREGGAPGSSIDLGRGCRDRRAAGAILQQMQRDRSFGSLTRLIAGAALADDVRLSQFCAAKRPLWNGPHEKYVKTGKAAGMVVSFAALRQVRIMVRTCAYRAGIAGAFAGAGRTGAKGARCAVRPVSDRGKPESGREGRGRQGAGRRLRRPSNIGCRRIPPPSRPSCFPAARSPSPRPRARSACSTTRASRRPTSPTPPISSMAPTPRCGR